MISNSTLPSAAILIALLFTACGKSENPTPAPGKTKPEVVVVVPPPLTAKVLLPVRMESAKGAITLTYLKNTGLLSGIEATDGTKEQYLYTDKNELNRYDRYQGTTKEYTVYYFRDQNGRVIQGIQNDVDGQVLTPTGSYKIAYNNDARLSTITWLNTSKEPVAASERSYDPTGNVVKLRTSRASANNQSFSYDDKHGIFENVKFKEILSIESLQQLLLASSGNLLTATDEHASANNLVYSYTYGADNYPVSMTITTSKGARETFKITYQ